MRLLLPLAALCVVVLAACSSPAPTASAPTSPPAAAPTLAPTVSSAASPAAKPAVAAPAPSPSPGIAASPAASPAAAPAASPAASPSAAPPVNAALLSTSAPTPGFALRSSAFTEGGNLPGQFSCDAPGGGQSPPLSWSGAPSGTQAFALVIQDPDTGATPFTHWVVYNIPGSTTQLEANQPAADRLPNGAMQGQNGRQVVAYQPACPSVGSPPHHYTFQLFALDGPLSLRPGASIGELQQALSGHVLGQTRLVALFGH